jgi:hypothetical protein
VRSPVSLGTTVGEKLARSQETTRARLVTKLAANMRKERGPYFGLPRYLADLAKLSDDPVKDRSSIFAVDRMSGKRVKDARIEPDKLFLPQR